MSKTSVYLIGAGPGDEELITVRGLKKLSQADVVLYDHLASASLLTYAKEGAELISVGKFASDHTMTQDEINNLMIQKAQQGKTVARLKGGDCYLFGRGGEEAEACYNAGVAFEVIPGVTSALAAACYGGIPPTHRDYTSDVAIVTGHRKQGDKRPIAIPRAGTVIFLMSVGNIKNIIASLMQAGYEPQTPIAAVEHGTCYNQRVIKGTLETFLDVIESNLLRTPAIFIVGKVVELQEKLDWYSKKPKILHLGNHPQRYSHLGVIVHRQLIRCEPVESNELITKCINNASRYDWIVFTSPNGIWFFFEKLYAAGQDARVFATTKFAVIGSASGQQLAKYGIRADICPSNESSKGLLEAFTDIDVIGKSFLLPQAKVSSPELPEGLSQRGAEITKLTLYETVEADCEDIDFDYIDKVLFTSGSTVRAFMNKFTSLPEHVEALCLGIPTQTVAKGFGIEAKIIKM